MRVHFFCLIFYDPPCNQSPLPRQGYTKGAVTQNLGEKGVNSVLDYVSSSNDLNLLKGLYEQTLETLRRAITFNVEPDLKGSLDHWVEGK